MKNVFNNATLILRAIICHFVARCILTTTNRHVPCIFVAQLHVSYACAHELILLRYASGRQAGTRTWNSMTSFSLKFSVRPLQVISSHLVQFHSLTELYSGRSC